MENKEKILKINDGRFVIFPLNHNDIWKYYKDHFSTIWSAEEIDLSNDLSDWENLNDNERFFIKNILSFFAASDGIVNENIAENFIREVQYPEAKFFYGMQIMMENVHCVTSETKILTDNGNIPIIDLVNNKVNVWNGIEFSEVIIKETGVQNIYKITLSDGTILRCTDGHKWYIRTGNQLHPERCKKTIVETKNLKIDDRIYPFNLPLIEFKNPDNFLNPYIHGFFCGDGTYSNGYPQIKLYGDKEKLINLFNLNSNNNKDKFRFYITDKINKPKFFVPSNYSIETKLKWLSGLFDADGCINLNPKKTATSIQYSSVNLQFIQDVKMLLTTLGIQSNLKLLKEEGFSNLPDGKGGYKDYETKPVYCLYITTVDVTKLIKLGLQTSRLNLLGNEKLISKKKLIKVVSIEDENKSEMTYCFNEPNRHSGIFNGILTSQSETYSILIDTYIKDFKEKEECFNALQFLPAVKKKAEWALKWIDSDSFAERLLAFIAVEGIFFSGSFSAIFWLKNRGLLPGLCKANRLIFKDENLHCEFAIHLFNNHIENKPDKKRIKEILLSALDIEKEFITTSIPVSLIGMNSNLMKQYLEFVTDQLLLKLGLEKEFHSEQPFKFMEQIGMEVKENFFENRAAEYKRADLSGKISFDEDF